MIPKPSPEWGAWRREPVTVIGCTIYPHLMTDKDRERIDSRYRKNHDDHDNDNDRA